MKKYTITIIREHRLSGETLGKLYLDDKYFGYTLEDIDRGLVKSDPLATITGKKIHGQTAIPKGMYSVFVTMSPRFKRRTPEVLNVPGFTGVRIHGGNHRNHTEGCPLIARNQYINKPSAWAGIKNWIQGSLEKELTKILDNGQYHTLIIQ